MRHNFTSVRYCVTSDEVALARSMISYKNKFSIHVRLFFEDKLLSILYSSIIYSKLFVFRIILFFAASALLTVASSYL